MNHRALKLALCAAPLMITGCRVGPKVRCSQRSRASGLSRKPARIHRKAFKENTAGGNTAWQQADPADTIPRGAWWTIFNDAELNNLEPQVETANQTLGKPTPISPPHGPRSACATPTASPPSAPPRQSAACVTPTTSPTSTHPAPTTACRHPATHRSQLRSRPLGRNSPQYCRRPRRSTSHRRRPPDCSALTPGRTRARLLQSPHRRRSPAPTQRHRRTIRARAPHHHRPLQRRHRRQE